MQQILKHYEGHAIAIMSNELWYITDNRQIFMLLYSHIHGQHTNHLCVDWKTNIVLTMQEFSDDGRIKSI